MQICLRAINASAAVATAAAAAATRIEAKTSSHADVAGTASCPASAWNSHRTSLFSCNQNAGSASKCVRTTYDRRRLHLNAQLLGAKTWPSSQQICIFCWAFLLHVSHIAALFSVDAWPTADEATTICVTRIMCHRLFHMGGHVVATLAGVVRCSHSK